MNLFNLTVKEASELLAKREISSQDLVSSCLERIKEQEPKIHAFITVTEKLALQKAKEVDNKRSSDEKLSKLAGIPFSLKDVYSTKGIRTTAGSKILSDYQPQYDATVYKRLAAADAVLVGKTNCDPFGFGTSTEYSAYGPTKNPVDLKRVPGGSSGGSAAAVAYGGGLFSIGEDTGGSIRCPASFCGIVGLKPTYGRVSRYGTIPYASSYDTVGPMTKTVEDNALVLQVIAGKDSLDATTSSVKPVNYGDYLHNSLENRTIGLPKEYFTDDLDKEVKAGVLAAVEKFKKLGCKIKEISLPYTEYAIAAYYVVGLSEASSNLARFDGIRYGFKRNGKKYDLETIRGEGFGPEEKRRIMIGTYALSAGYADRYYKKAQAVRALLKQDFARAFSEVDIVLTPTMPVLPFKFGENLDDPLKMWLVDAFTVSLNPSGLPGLSIPADKSKDGLPIGLQLIGPHFQEETLYNFAYQFEHYGV